MTTRKLARKDTLGRFRIVREIGRGGSGVVYEGVDPSDGGKVALKVLPAIRALDAQRVERFLKEAENARNLKHGNIVSLREVGQEGGNYFLVMQYVDGRPLDVVWKEELIDFDTSARVVLQVLDALEHAHGRGLIHLDVKPQNILLDKSGTAFLTDFGLARGAGLAGAVAGTPKYMSPEQAAGRPDVDFRSDLYSLGVTLYNLITHAHPFEGEDVRVILRNVIAGEFQRPRDINNRIPSRLEAVVMKAMERDPSRRYRTAAEFRADIESYLKGESVTASVPILKRRGFRLVKTRGALYAALLVLVAAAGSVITYEAARTREPVPPSPDPGDGARKAREFSAEGDRLFSEDRLNDALALYAKSLELLPADPVTLVKVGQIQARMEHFDAASRYFSQALAVEPDLVEALLGRGESRSETGDERGAVADLDRAVTLLRAADGHPGTPELLSRALCGLGGLALPAGNVEEAARMAREAKELDPGNTRSRLLLGLALLESGRRDLALEEFKPLIAMEPGDARAKKDIERLKISLRVAEMQVQIPLLQAVAHYESGKYQQAVGYCLETLKIEPRNQGALLLLGRSLIALERFEDALEPLEAASASPAERPLALALRARASRSLGRLQDALQDSVTAASESPGLAEARIELGLAKAASGDREGAVKELEAARGIKPGDAEVSGPLAALYFEGGDFAAALASAKDVLAARPHDLRAMEIAARSNLENGSQDDALLFAVRAIAIEPSSTAAHAVRATVLLERSDFAGALESALVAASSRGDRVAALRIQAYALAGLGSNEGIEKACTALLAEIPGDAAALKLRAQARLDLGDPRGAALDFRAALAASPGDADALAGLAESLLAGGNPGQAVETARAAVAAGASLRGSHALGLGLMATGFPAEAADAFLPALEPGIPAARAGAIGADLSRALRMCGRLNSALEAARVAAAADPSCGAAARAVAELLADLGMGAEAAAAAGAVRGPEKDQFSAWIAARASGSETALAGVRPFPGEEGMKSALLARLALARGDVDKALAFAEAGFAAAPAFAAVRLERALARKGKGDATGFLEDADWLVKADPGNPEVRALRASVAWMIEDRREQAIADLAAAAAARPREAWIFRARADLLLKTGRPREAIRDMERLAVLDPGSADASRLLAETYEAVHLYAESALAWSRTERLAGGADPEARYRNLRALMLAGRFAECIEGAKSFSPGPYSGKVSLLEAECLLWSGRYTEAVDSAGSVQDRNPELSLEARCLRATAAVLRGASRKGPAIDNEDFVKAYFDLQSYYPQAQRGTALDPVQRSVVFTAMGMYQLVAESNESRAAEDFRKAAAAFPGSRTAARMLGRIAASGGQAVPPAEGLAQLEAALALSHHDASGIQHDRGRCLESLGRKGEAAAAYRISMESDPSNAESRKRLAAIEREK